MPRKEGGGTPGDEDLSVEDAQLGWMAGFLTESTPMDIDSALQSQHIAESRYLLPSDVLDEQTVTDGYSMGKRAAPIKSSRSSPLTVSKSLKGLQRCSAFKSTVSRHRCTKGRLRWLATWIGEDSVNAQARIRLLSRIWNDVTNFRPFTTIQEAEAVVCAQPSNIVIRLSSTMPGFVSVTYFNRTRNRPLHRRYAVCPIPFSGEARQLSESEENNSFSLISSYVHFTYEDSKELLDDAEELVSAPTEKLDFADVFGIDKYEGVISDPSSGSDYYSVAELANVLTKPEGSQTSGYLSPYTVSPYEIANM